MESLQAYLSDNDDEKDVDTDNLIQNDDNKESKDNGEVSVCNQINFDRKKMLLQSNFLKPIDSTPIIDVEPAYSQKALVNPHSKELYFNPKYDQFAPIQGPVNPFKSEIEMSKRNTLIGYVEPTNIDDFNFENQRRTKQSYGYIIDTSQKLGGKVKPSVFQSAPKRKGDKRKKDANLDGTDIDNYTGPWARYIDEETVSKPSDEVRASCEEYIAKMEARKKKPKTGGSGNDYEPIESRTALHIVSEYDYQGRSFMQAPLTEDVNFKSTEPPVKCGIARKMIHQWRDAHRSGVSIIRLFPKTGHLLLTGGMDKYVRLWELYGERRLIRSYHGHREPLKDISFNNDGSQMLTSAYDKYVKLWDVETGECIAGFTNKHVANVVRFNPDPERQHLFLAGCQNKKILCYDVRSGEIVQLYERHLGAVNSITFFDNNRRFVSTSDDRSLRLWEWDIPVDYRQLADPSMHSMPAVALSPNNKWLVCQSLDNQIVTYNLDAGFKKTRKQFKNQVAAGSACQLDFSPDMRYLISGDGDGLAYIWNFKTTDTVATWKAHDKATIAAAWLPHEVTKVVTGSWDGHLKLWE